MLVRSWKFVTPVLLLLAACRPGQDSNVQANDSDSGNAMVDVPALPVAEPPMDRAGLLRAAADAASAAALGKDDRPAQRPLDGKRFELRIRFGCPGPGVPVANAPFSLRFDSDKRTLRIRAAPELSLEEPWIAALAGDNVEAVEGFWMRRPWLLEPGCQPIPPAQDAGAAAPATAAPLPRTASASHRVGIAQFFTEAEPRTRRRDSRAYEATLTLDAEEQPSTQGYDLVLSGRLRRLPDARVIACHVVVPEAPPECVISAEFDRVRLERPGGELLAEWGGG